MRNPLLAPLALSALLVSGVASAATVRWHPGESPPPTEVTPASPTQIDAVSFTASTGAFYSLFGNTCKAENALGSPVISANLEAHELRVDSTPKPFPPNFCPEYYAPVNGIEGELGQLGTGSWTLVITNDNHPSMNVTLPFSVTAAPTASGALIVHTFANDTATATRFPFDRADFIARPLGRRCNPGHGGTACGAATLEQGAPLAGVTAVQPDLKTPLARFTLPRSALRVSATGSLPPLSPYRSIATYASNGRNGTGRFGPGRGPGKRTFTFQSRSSPQNGMMGGTAEIGSLAVKLQKANPPSAS